MPRFCYHERLSIAGNCRMCLVESNVGRKPIATCMTNISEGMSVLTTSSLTCRVREAVVEFLLLNHPLDCPVCDQGGECDLQDIGYVYGSDRGRHWLPKRSVEDIDLGPVIKTIMTRCIHCTRCIRFLGEWVGQNTLGLMGRGGSVEVTEYNPSPLHAPLFGNLVDLCPVGALTSRSSAHSYRAWDAQSHETVDPQDPLIPSIKVDTVGQEAFRILPKLDELVNEIWLSDKTRYSYLSDVERGRSNLHYRYHWRNIGLVDLYGPQDPRKLNLESKSKSGALRYSYATAYLQSVARNSVFPALKSFLASPGGDCSILSLTRNRLLYGTFELNVSEYVRDRLLPRVTKSSGIFPYVGNYMQQGHGVSFQELNYTGQAIFNISQSFDPSRLSSPSAVLGWSSLSSKHRQWTYTALYGHIALCRSRGVSGFSQRSKTAYLVNFFKSRMVGTRKGLTVRDFGNVPAMSRLCFPAIGMAVQHHEIFMNLNTVGGLFGLRGFSLFRFLYGTGKVSLRTTDMALAVVDQRAPRTSVDTRDSFVNPSFPTLTFWRKNRDNGNALLLSWFYPMVYSPLSHLQINRLHFIASSWRSLVVFFGKFHRYTFSFMPVFHIGFSNWRAQLLNRGSSPLSRLVSKSAQISFSSGPGKALAQAARSTTWSWPSLHTSQLSLLESGVVHSWLCGRMQVSPHRTEALSSACVQEFGGEGILRPSNSSHTPGGSLRVSSFKSIRYQYQEVNELIDVVQPDLNELRAFDSGTYDSPNLGHPGYMGMYGPTTPCATAPTVEARAMLSCKAPGESREFFLSWFGVYKSSTPHIYDAHRRLVPDWFRYFSCLLGPVLGSYSAGHAELLSASFFQPVNSLLYPTCFYKPLSDLFDFSGCSPFYTSSRAMKTRSFVYMSRRGMSTGLDIWYLLRSGVMEYAESLHLFYKISWVGFDDALLSISSSANLVVYGPVPTKSVLSYDSLRVLGDRNSLVGGQLPTLAHSAAKGMYHTKFFTGVFFGSSAVPVNMHYQYQLQYDNYSSGSPTLMMLDEPLIHMSTWVFEEDYLPMYKL